jgi:CheY-like chemotaxis protein
MSSQRRIMVVDDDASVREITRTSLELVGGFDVICASSGAECLELSLTDRPDAILLDVMMPGLDGPSTFGILQEREETKSLPVVLLTAKAQEADRRRFAELGVAGVLTKPFDPMTLPDQVAALLGWTH